MKIVITAFLCCFSFALCAQQHGTVKVVINPMIDSLIAKRISLNTKPAASGNPSGKPAATIVTQMGYRVQVFYGSDRRKVFSEQSRFQSAYPALNTYISYKEPNYYLRVGDFRTKLEAQRLMNELRPSFPTLFIFREKINAPNLDYSNDN